MDIFLLHTITPSLPILSLLLLHGCTFLNQKIDVGCGRTMSDVSSMFVVYLLELQQWYQDESTKKVCVTYITSTRDVSDLKCETRGHVWS